MSVLTLLAIALFFSLHQVSIKRGTVRCDTTTGTFISIATTAVVFTALSAFKFSIPPLSFIAAMAVAGVLHFLIARTAFYFCIDRVGANAAGLLAATRIMFAAILGCLFLAEELTPKLLVMSGMIFTGIAFLFGIENLKDVKGLALGLFTGFVAALSSAVVRAGMAIYPSPLLGMSIGFLASFFLFPFLTIGRIERVEKRYWPFVLGGVFVGLGHYLRYKALAVYPVSVVEPFLSMYPLFTVFFSWIFLRDVEILSFRLIVAALLIVSGVEIYLLL